MTTRVLGVPVPVQGLAAWLRGSRAEPRRAHRARRAGPRARAAPGRLGDRVRVRRRRCDAAARAHAALSARAVEVRVVVDAGTERAIADAARRSPRRRSSTCSCTSPAGATTATTLLESLFVLIDLADTLHARRARRRRDSRARATSTAWPRSDDLALRAARALQAGDGARRRRRLSRSTSAFRSARGLGGGSSDAASVLLALNRLWALALSRAALSRIARGARRRRAVLRRRRAPRSRAASASALTPVTLPALLAGARASVACTSRPRRSSRAPRIDTIDALGENRRLFRSVTGGNDLRAGRRGALSASAPTRWRCCGAFAPQARMTGSGARVFARCSRARGEAAAAHVAAGARRRGSCARWRGIRSPRSRDVRSGSGGRSRDHAASDFRWGVAKWLRHRILIPACEGSNPSSPATSLPSMQRTRVARRWPIAAIRCELDDGLRAHACLHRQRQPEAGRRRSPST